MSAPYAAVVLAGGAARRMGGADKPALVVGGRSMLHRVLAAVADARPRVVVGPPRAGLPVDVVQVREDPPGGGPVAATAAGLLALSEWSDGGSWGSGPRSGAAAPRSGRSSLIPPRGTAPPDPSGSLGGGVVAVLAADLPYLTAVALAGLVAAVRGSDHDGAVLVDDAGRRQLLCGVWRIEALRVRLAALGAPFGQPMRRLVEGLRVAELPAMPGAPPPWYDCDTEEDLRRAEELHP